MSWLPYVPLGPGAEAFVAWVKTHLPTLLGVITDVFNGSSEGVADFVLLFHPLLIAAIFALVAAWVRSLWLALFVIVGMTLIMSVGLWNEAVQTLAMVLVATVVALVIGIPLGILAARNSVVSLVTRPVLDFLQTTPALVYLVPVVTFFRIGYAPGVVATIVFAIAPAVRLTELAIRQVDAETVEAGKAFGGTPWQILRGIQLPLGLPTIMAGVNQVIMLGLSMVVMAGFVGAPGLGKSVTLAFGTLDVGAGFEAGLAIVILAIFLDRVTGAIGHSTPHSLAAWWRRRRKPAEAPRSAVVEISGDQDSESDSQGEKEIEPSRAVGAGAPAN